MGVTGEPGASGELGVPGTTGTQGTKGSKGPSGRFGPRGTVVSKRQGSSYKFPFIQRWGGGVELFL